MPHRNPLPAHHILAFAQTLKGGGVERALLRLARGWVGAGRRVTLVFGSADGPLSAELPDGAEVIELGDPRYRSMFGIAPVIREMQPDVLFCPGNHYTAALAWARLRLGRETPPTVAKVSNALVRPELTNVAAWGYRRWLHLHPRFIDELVAMTAAMREEAVAEMRMPPERVQVIANPATQPIPGAMPVTLPGGRYILGVGRLERQKRWDRLISAMPRLADPDVSLAILGEGTERPALEALVAKLGLQGRVSLPGHAADPLGPIGGAAAVVLTSDFEGVPGVLREALSVGTPVVATESSVAVREIVSSPELGSVIPRDSGRALVSALDHWLEPGRPRPVPRPAPGSRAAEEYLSLFDRLAGQRSR